METTYTLITGASGGIGYEMAKIAAGDHHNLVLVARTGEKLELLAGKLRAANKIEVVTIVMDLAEKDGAGKLISLLKEEHLAVDTLVNNAGFGDSGDFAAASLQKNLEMINLNISALTQLTHYCLQNMGKTGRGRILNVASTAAFMPGPGMAVYYASKAYVLSFSEALAREVKAKGITVTTLCPGLTDTNFFIAAGLRNSFLNSLFPKAAAEKVAKAGYHGMIKGKHLVVPGLINKLVISAPRFLPRVILRNSVYKMHSGRAT